MFVYLLLGIMTVRKLSKTAKKPGPGRRNVTGIRRRRIDRRNVNGKGTGKPRLRQSKTSPAAAEEPEVTSLARTVRSPWLTVEMPAAARGSEIAAGVAAGTGKGRKRVVSEIETEKGRGTAAEGENETLLAEGDLSAQKRLASAAHAAVENTAGRAVQAGLVPSLTASGPANTHPSTVAEPKAPPTEARFQRKAPRPNGLPGKAHLLPLPRPWKAPRTASMRSGLPSAEKHRSVAGYITLVTIRIGPFML